MNSRRGLKRHGMRSYIVAGPRSTWIIERERPWRFAIRRVDMPPQFYAEKFRRLALARAAVEFYAGIKPYPYPEVPLCLRRWEPST